ncbi:MAG: FtsX-like permease family protein [Dehalococcoidia bacterium]
MGELFAGWRLALQRLVANGRLMLIAALGVLAAATLLAATPVYAAAMTDLGLHFRLERQLARVEDHVPFLDVDRMLLGDPVDRARREAIARVTQARIGWLGTTVIEDRSAALDLTFPGHEASAPPRPVAVTAREADPLRQRWSAFVYTLSDFERAIDVVEGRLPGPSSAGLEVVLPDGFQRHAKIGDTVRLGGPSWDDCVHVPRSLDTATALDEVPCGPTTFASMSATATIVGFVRPKDASDLRWQLFAGGWRVPDQPILGRDAGASAPAGSPEERAMSLITTREQFYGAFAARMPELGSRYRAGVVLDARALTLPDVPRAIDDLAAWRTDITDRLGLAAGVRLTALDVLQGFRNAQTFSQIPLLLILLQVVGIVLYYVVMVMAMLLEPQAEEIGVLRSRGATTTQLVGLNVVEGAVLAIPAALAGPWIAAQVVATIGRLPAFHVITGGAPLVAHVTPEASLLGSAGAALAFGAILLPSYLVARKGILRVRREEARPAGRSVVQRYYLDFAFVIAAAFLLWQLSQRGTVFDPGSVGGWSTDPMLLLSPLVITVAVALLMLRFYPPVVRLAVRALLLFRGTAVAIGLRRAGRSPAAYARLMLLLAMSVSVGTFAASYGPTVGRSLDERVRYTAGADARADIERPDRIASERALPAVRALPGVADAALAFRGSLSTANGGSVGVLSIDPGRAPSMLWFRDDFSARPMPDLLRLLGSEGRPGGGLLLPDGATTVTIQVRSANLQRSSLQARFRDASGEMWDSLLALPERAGAGWGPAAASVPEFAARPVTLVGIRVGERLGLDLRRDGALQLDRVAARVGAQEVVLDDFEGAFTWSLYGAPTRDETFRQADGDAASGRRFGEWKWNGTITAQDRMLALNDPAVPLSAIVNREALSTLGTTDGGVAMVILNGLQIPVFVRGVVDLFPTLDPARGFMVLNAEQLQSIAGTVGAVDPGRPNELWLRFRDDTSLTARRETLTRLMAADAPLRVKSNPLIQAVMLDDTRADPTLQAAGSGILTVAFLAVLGLSTLGIVVTLVLGARTRAVEFAVLRAVGTSGRQILRALLLEWGIVVAVGAVVGLVLGRVVASLMLRFLSVTERGDRVLPPFIVQTDWRALGLGVGVLVAVVGVTLYLSWSAAMRQSTGTRLRLTE